MTKSAYGWSDVMLIMAFPDGLGANVPFELQITHSKLFNIRKGADMHHLFAQSRNQLERLEDLERD